MLTPSPLRAHSTVSGGGLPAVSYKAAIFIESSICDPKVFESHREKQWPKNLAMAQAITKRRSSWLSRDEARAFFRNRLPWKTWDPRELDLFVVRSWPIEEPRAFGSDMHGQRHCLKDVQVPDGGDKSAMVTLCCSPIQEGAQFLQQESYNRATDLIAPVSATVPVHFVLGAQPSLMCATLPHSV